MTAKHIAAVIAFHAPLSRSQRPGYYVRSVALRWRELALVTTMSDEASSAWG